MSNNAAQKGKHSSPGEGNIYAKANEVIVKITGADTDNTFEVVEENCKPGFQSRLHYHIKAYETFYVFEGSAVFQVGGICFTPVRVHASIFHPESRTRSWGANVDDLQPRRHRGDVCRHACAHTSAAYGR
jgi:gentisate 1,2-dioxygenase